MTLPTAEPTSAACLVCGTALAAHPRLPGLLRCAGCTFVTADVQLTDAQLRDLYGADYFHGEEYADYVAEGDELRVNFRRRLDTLLALQPEAERGRLYEVGAAYGFFLDEARKDYAEVAGIDITDEGPRYAREVLGLDVASGDYLAAEVGEPVDALCFWDTVEHLGRPREFLEKAARDVRPGGLVTLTTGDLGSLNARLRGKRWRMIHPPTHLHYFSRSTLAQLLDRCGFDVVHVSTAGNVRSVRGILYGVLVLRAGRQGLYDRLSRLPGMNRSVSLDLRDIMYVVARRRAA